MRKYIRQWVKEEKRIIKLFFQKGFMDRNCPAIKDLYWAEYRQGRRQRKGIGRNKYSHTDYLPEIHYWSCDYWGEGDEHALIPELIEGLWWSGVDMSKFTGGSDWPPSTFVYKGRKWLIKYLKALPTVNRSSRINRLLIRNKED